MAITLTIKLDLDDARELRDELTRQIANADRTSGCYWVGRVNEKGEKIQFAIQPATVDVKRPRAMRQRRNVS